ncbi:PH domain-containing protein [Sphaerisporangium album]|uniref:PH domain-containing protein n=1 Tax=Sphaerisporangium album TaxID=509200 RepID=A0A367FSD4_9ACTN|nr:PH domain-containing protein [Sphaerisporangium album]RCG32819.1 PH domain-containing protein [Sphaerisporangium album]
MTGISRQARQWRVRRDFTALKWTAAAAFCVLGFVSGDVRAVILCVGGALLLGGFALYDVVAPVRLAADDQGLTVVTGVARRRRVLWPEITNIRVAETTRYGLRWSLLEIETAESLHLFSSFELGTSCMEAADDLYRLRPA